MSLIIECACGTVIEGSSEQELLAAARNHIAQLHPGIGEPPSNDDLIAMSHTEPQSQRLTLGEREEG